MANYKYYPDRPKKLTAVFADAEYGKLLAKVDLAEASTKPDLWLELYSQWNALKAYISSEGARIGHVFNLNMSDKKLEVAEKYFREKVVPAVMPGEHQLTVAFLKSRHIQALLDRYGSQLKPVYETQLKPLDPINTNLQVQIGELTKRYDKMIAETMVEVDGQKMTLWKVRSLGTSADARLRKTAFLASGDWFLASHDTLADIYDQLVVLRHKKAQNVSLPSYIDYAYQSMGRTDYGPQMVSEFRKNIKDYVVPIWQKIAEDNAKRLGTSKLQVWDVRFTPGLTLPLGIAPIKQQLSKSERMFERLSPKLNKHFRRMVNEGLIDLESRPNKRSGAYCTDFSDEGRVAILLNSTGDDDDLSTLTHEMGHAFQGWESQSIEAVDLQWGTADFCEVHSMGMEFLSLPYLDEFFITEDVANFAKLRWQEAIYYLCYICIVDEFQHWVYANISATSEERDEKWCELTKSYLPGISYPGAEKYRKNRWYAQGHIFSSPFYYIDYALATVVAMQLAVLDSQSHQKALDTYLKLCNIGGTKSFLSAVRYGGLKSPFDLSVIKSVADYAENVLLL